MILNVKILELDSRYLSRGAKNVIVSSAEPENHRCRAVRPEFDLDDKMIRTAWRLEKIFKKTRCNELAANGATHGL